jgi:hypothetical protein
MPTVRVFATLILVVVKPDAIWVGADGLRTDGRSSWLEACKIHEAYGGVLLKHSKDQDKDQTFSADEEVQQLIRTKRTFGEFQKAAALTYKKNEEKIVEEVLRDVKRVQPEQFDGDLLRQEPNARDAAAVDMGLVFITVADGKLVVYELHVEPTAIAVPTSDDSQRYRWVVEQPVWKTRPSQEDAYAYPSTPIEEGTRTWLIADPKIRVPDLILQNESKFACVEAPPNVLLKVSRATADPRKRYTASAKKRLMNTAVIEYTAPGACPSWKAKPTPRPAMCTEEELRRENSSK